MDGDERVTRKCERHRAAALGDLPARWMPELIPVGRPLQQFPVFGMIGGHRRFPDSRSSAFRAGRRGRTTESVFTTMVRCPAAGTNETRAAFANSPFGQSRGVRLP